MRQKKYKKYAQHKLINPPGLTAKYFLQFSKNKFTTSNPVIAIFQGGVIR